MCFEKKFQKCFSGFIYYFDWLKEPFGLNNDNEYDPEANYKETIEIIVDNQPSQILNIKEEKDDEMIWDIIAVEDGPLA